MYTYTYISLEQSIAIDMLRKTPFKCCGRPYTTYFNIESLRVRLYVVQTLHMLSKNYTTYEIFTQHVTKIYTTHERILDIYEILDQLMTYFTGNIQIFDTTYDTNLYNTLVYKKNLQHITNNI